jgi:hypothetical protein
MEFPELKKMAYEMYREWSPDTLIVEKKAAGAPPDLRNEEDGDTDVGIYTEQRIG